MQSEILNMTLRRLHDLVGYILIVARGDGKVLVLGTDNAPNRLTAINAASPLEHDVRIYRTDHYAKILAALKHRFRAWSEDGLGVWFHLDPSELYAAIDEFDLGTGARVRMGKYLAVGGRAWVKGLGPGTISSLDSRTGAATVRLERPVRDLTQVIATPSMIKPHIRAAA